MTITFFRIAATVSLAAFSLPAVAQQLPAPPNPAPVIAVTPLPAGVAARVGNRNITYAELAAKLRSWQGQPLVQDMARSVAIEAQAKKYNVTVSATEMAAELAKVTQEQVDRYRTSGAGMITWSQIAARDGISEAFLRDNVRLSLLARKTYAKFVEANVPGLAGQIKVAHIVLSNLATPPKPGDDAPDTPAEKAKRDADAKTKADTILADIKAGKITFEDAAKQFSADKGADGQGSAAQGGVLPWMPRQLPDGRPVGDPAFIGAAFGLAKPGDITPVPVKAPYGYHIIKLIAKGDDAPAAEKAAFRAEQVERQTNTPDGIRNWLAYILQSSNIQYAAGAMTPKPAAAKPVAKPAVKKP